MDLSQYNVWMLLAVTGFFTAFGNLIAQFVWSEVIKPRLDRLHKRLKRKKKRI